MSRKLDAAIAETGTRFLIFPQPRFLQFFEQPEVVKVTIPPKQILPGPADDRMYVLDAVNKRPYNRFNQRPYLGTFNPPVLPGADGHFDHLDLNSREQVVFDKIKRFHPQIGNYLDSEEPYASMAWDRNKWSAGAFASSKPLDLQRFFPEVSQPAAHLFFAGEHLSPYPSWIQGALWSALQGVRQIVLA